MHDWKHSMVRRAASIRDTIKTIDASAMQIALVVDDNARLIGSVTDGDVRRAILRGADLGTAVEFIMNPHPKTAAINESRENILLMMRRQQLHQIPILDETGTLVGVEMLDDLLRPVTKDNPVVLMAGGLGSRLRPLTDDCPKPMLRVGDKPILETILASFIESGSFCGTSSTLPVTVLRPVAPSSRMALVVRVPVGWSPLTNSTTVASPVPFGLV